MTSSWPSITSDNVRIVRLLDAVYPITFGRPGGVLDDDGALQGDAFLVGRTGTVIGPPGVESRKNQVNIKCENQIFIEQLRVCLAIFWNNVGNVRYFKTSNFLTYLIAGL